MKTDYIKQAKQIFAKDERIVPVRFYVDGFVPNSYEWPAMGFAVDVYASDPDKQCISNYNRKRSRGAGPDWVAYSERGGRLLSGWSTAHRED